MSGILADPAVVNTPDRQGIEIIPALPPCPPDQDQVSVFQHFQMLHHGAAIHVREGRAEHSRSLRLVLQAIKHRPSAGVSQRLENHVVFVLA